jgi:TRAP-type C4-dicarboxylate transport system permease small subunit
MDSREKAQTMRVIAMILIFAGILLLAYGGYAYAKENNNGQTVDRVTGNVTTTVANDRDVAIPMWTGAAAILVGLAMLFVPRRDDLQPIDRTRY